MKKFTLKNKKTLSILGYLIISNNQIHNYQIRYIKKLVLISSLLKDYSYIEEVLTGGENRIKLEDSIDYFNSEDTKTRNILYEEMIVISSLDGIIDKYENDFLDQLKISEEEFKVKREQGIKTSSNYILKFQTDDKDRREALNKLPKEIEIIKYLTKRIREVFIKTKLRQEEIEKDDNNTKTYDDIIKIGKEDYETVRPIYEELLAETDKIYKLIDEKLEKINGELNIEEEVKENIAKISQGINRGIINKVHETFSELYIKENTLEYLTISFLGRTKAGKSTLHTILTGEGEDSIGIGKQRTTRYNRVYQLDKLRLIDTPGIGAAEADGRTDEEIAKSVIGESDIVCIVVSDDSVQEYVFDLAETIIKRNKPVVIVLNHKQNIQNEVRYKIFKREPNKWLINQSTKGILGHIERIYDYANEKKFEDMIKYYPVFLLPALMSMDEEYKEDKSILIDSSNIKEFKRGIKNTISSVGTLLRSQTIIDDSRALFTESKDQLDRSITKLKDVHKKFSDSKNTTIEKMNNSKEKLIRNSREDLKDSYFELENKYALEFAEKNYESKNLNEKWDIFLEEIKFNKKIESAIEYNFNEFNREIKEVLDETLEDFKIGMDYYFSLDDMDDMSINFDFKKLGGILGSLCAVGVAVAGFFSIIAPPVAILLGLISAVISISSGFLKSKAQKRQEAIDKLYRKLKESINRNKDKNIEKTISIIKKESTNQVNNIENAFKSIENSLSYVLKSGKDSLEVYSDKIKELDFNYAIRIFEYLAKENIDRNEVKNIILGVERKYGEYINIKVNYDKEVDVYSEGLIREKIKIINTKS